MTLRIFTAKLIAIGIVSFLAGVWLGWNTGTEIQIEEPAPRGCIVYIDGAAACEAGTFTPAERTN